MSSFLLAIRLTISSPTHTHTHPKLLTSTHKMSRHHGYKLPNSASGNGTRSRYAGTTGGTLPRPPDTVIMERPHASRRSRPTDGRGSKNGKMARSKSYTSRHAGRPGGTGPMPSREPVPSGRMVRSRSHNASKSDRKPRGTGSALPDRKSGSRSQRPRGAGSSGARSRSKDAGRRASGTLGGTLPRPPDTLMNSDERRLATRMEAMSDRDNTPPRQRRRRKSDSRPRQRARKANPDAPFGEKILIGLSKLFHGRPKPKE